MKFLFLEISIITCSITMQNNCSPLNNNTTSFLGVGNNNVNTSNNFSSINDEEEKDLAGYLYKQLKDNLHLGSSTQLAKNECFGDVYKIYKLATGVFSKVFAIDNIKSSIDKTNYSRKFTFYLTKYYRIVRNYIQCQEIEELDDSLSIFVGSLARKTYPLLYFVGVLGEKIKEEDKNILKKKLLSAIDVKFKDEESLEVIQFFDKKKLNQFFNNLAYYDAQTDSICKITELISKYRSKIYSQDKIKESTSTDDSISNKIDSMINTTEKVDGSLTPKKPATLNVKSHENDTTNENTSEGSSWKHWLFLAAFIILSIPLCCYMYHSENERQRRGFVDF